MSSAFKSKTKILVSFLICFILISSTLLTGCVSGEMSGRAGGVLQGVMSTGAKVKCATSSLNAEGKVMEIDGVELKIPIDWSYARSEQPDFNGVNWEGDDGYRGIGMFNCNEEGDKSEAFKNSYSINMRWEYCSYGFQDPGQFKTQGGYYAISEIMPDVKLGGTSADCTEPSGAKSRRIIDQKSIPDHNKYWNALKKAKFIVYNPKTGKACVCGPGFIPSGLKDDLNWGGAPLFALGGISEAVSNAITDKGNYDEIQPHTGDDNVALEVYFADPEAPLGPCEFQGNGSGGGHIASKNKGKCDTSPNVDNSNAANLAVSVSYDNDNPTYKDHVMVQRPTGSTSGSTLLPTTDLSIGVRKASCGDEKTADCGYFVASIVRATLDRDYITGGTDSQRPYMEGSDKWQEIGTGTYEQLCQNCQLEPGDVFITCAGESGHTVMYVGNEAIKEQYDYITDANMCIVGASWDKHGPYIQSYYADLSRKYKAFRYIAEPNPVEGIEDKLSELGLL